MILSTYYCSSKCVGTEETIPSLINYVEKSRSANNEIQLALTFESMERLAQFTKKVESLDCKGAPAIIKDMVKNMVYHYFLWHNVPFVGNGQLLASKYFKNNKKLLKQVQNRSLRTKK